MASTYSNLGIELMGTGDQAGTWGTTTNTNLTCIDTAICGNVTISNPSISSSSPYDLDVDDTNNSDGKNRILFVTSGSDLGGTSYIRITKNGSATSYFEGWYFVRNSLQGNRSLIIFQGSTLPSSSNYATIPNGKDVIIYCDGAGIVRFLYNNANFTSISTSGAASITGNLDVTGQSTLTGNVGIGTAASGSYMISLDGGSVTPVYFTTSSLATAWINSTDASNSGAYAYFRKLSASPANGDALFYLRFAGNNSTPSVVEYSRISTLSTTIAAGSEVGQLILGVRTDGALTNIIYLNGGAATGGEKLGIGTNSPNGRVEIYDANNRTEATAQFTISGSGYAAAHYLDGSAYKIKTNSASRTIQVIANSNGVNLNAGAVSWGAVSDETQKDIIEPIIDASEKLKNVRTVIGKYKTDEDGTRRSFLIAQDIQAVLPEAVDADSEGILTLRYTEVIPLLVAAIKEQQAMIEDLKARVTALGG